jgi:hypothetical protein
MSLLNLNNIFNLITGRGRETKSVKDTDVIIVGRPNDKASKGFIPVGMRFKDLKDAILKGISSGGGEVVLNAPEYIAYVDQSGAPFADPTAVELKNDFFSAQWYYISTGTYGLYLPAPNTWDVSKVLVMMNGAQGSNAVLVQLIDVQWIEAEGPYGGGFQITIRRYPSDGVSPIGNGLAQLPIQVVYLGPQI